MTSPRVESLTATNSSEVSQPPHRKRFLVIFGTRPEAMKLCPVIAALPSPSVSNCLQTSVCVTAQHGGLLDQVLAAFDVRPDFDLNAMQPAQTLSELTGRLMLDLAAVFEHVKPAMVVVQGDTTTTLCGALSAFYSNLPVAHVQAGLRTGICRACSSLLRLAAHQDVSQRESKVQTTIGV